MCVSILPTPFNFMLYMKIKRIRHTNGLIDDVGDLSLRFRMSFRKDVNDLCGLYGNFSSITFVAPMFPLRSFMISIAH